MTINKSEQLQNNFLTIILVLLCLGCRNSINGEWQDAAGSMWDSYAITLPDNHGSIFYVCQKAFSGDSITAEHVQGIVFPGNTKINYLPYNVGGKIQIDVFWYDATKERGPFVRLQDRWGEYLVDLNNQCVQLIVRTKSGRVFAGKIIDEEGNYSIYGLEDDLKVSICGQLANEIKGPLAATKGKNIAHIEEN